MCEIRIAKEEDIAALVAINLEIQRIHSERFPAIFKSKVLESDVTKDLLHALREERNQIIVLEKGLMVIGYCWFRVVEVAETTLIFSSKSLNIVHFGVLQKFRGLGYGKMLMRNVQNLGKENNVNQIVVDSWVFNTQAVSFYQSCDFEIRNNIFWFKPK